MRVRSLIFVAALAGLSAGTGAVDDRTEIQKVLDAHAAAWTAGDAHAAAAVMTDDADWLRRDGVMIHGKAAIEAMHREIFAGPGKNTRHEHPGSADIRFIRPDVAIVDGDSFVGPMDAKPTPDTIGRYTAVFVKERGAWKVTAFRPSPTPPRQPAR
jgi:uncharacterized protein (TIGR02246 family)